jgi:hypothetical protein
MNTRANECFLSSYCVSKIKSKECVCSVFPFWSSEQDNEATGYSVRFEDLTVVTIKIAVL